MADEYIKRGALLAAYDKEHEGEPGRARKLIEDAPAADVQPVRHGRWVYDEGEFACSECDGVMVRNVFNYCPWCGARMDGET